MKIKTVRKWSEESDEKIVEWVARFIVLLIVGCYAYIGYLITLL